VPLSSPLLTERQKDLLKEIGKEYKNWKNSEEGKNRSDEHQSHVNILRDWLSKEKIADMSEDNLIEIYDLLWANNNFTNKEWRARNKIIKPNGMEKIRIEFDNLIYGAGTIAERYDRCDKNLNGVSKSTITELLYCISPIKYCIWNDAADIVITKLGLDNVISAGKSNGEKYQKLVDVYSDVVNELQPYGITDFFDLDTFLYYRFTKKDLPSIPIKNLDGQTFWQVAAGKNQEFWDEFKDTNTVGVGWNDVGDISGLSDIEIEKKFQETKYTQGVNSLQNFARIKPGDIIFVNKGKKGILGIAKVVGNHRFDSNRNYNHVLGVKWLSTDYQEIEGGWSRNWAVARIMDKEMMMKYLPKAPLESPGMDGIFEDYKQIVLYGPPGTSKTFTAKRIAIENITKHSVLPENIDTVFDKLQESGYVEIVQFHPSYSYEDFVEGIRPFSNGNANAQLNYKVQDGIFKKICNSALNSFHDDVDHHYVLISNFVKFDPIDPQKFNLEAQQGGIHRLNKTDFEKILNHLKSIGVNVSNFEKINSFSNFLILNSSENNEYKDIEGFWYHFSKQANAPVIMREAVEGGDTAFVYYKKRIGYTGIGIIKKNELVTNPPYFMIIDEINRGDPARIFGELIYGLEYRDHPIKTQYSEFDEQNSNGKLTIPSNLYIIGTMNTADRSISLFDIALRRRFAFKGLFPDYDLLSTHLGFSEFADVQNKFKNIEKESKDDQLKILSILAMHKINEKIIDPQEFKLGRERQIGHTYFMKLRENPKKFVNIWKLEVVPLLEEFFYAKASILETLLSDKIFSEKKGVEDFTEEELVTLLKFIISEKTV